MQAYGQAHGQAHVCLLENQHNYLTTYPPTDDAARPPQAFEGDGLKSAATDGDKQKSVATNGNKQKLVATNEDKHKSVATNGDKQKVFCHEWR